MKIQLASHHGMCFGVRDALRATFKAAKKAPVTVLGQLVHNPIVDQHLKTLGVQQGDLSELTSSKTADVVITAHGAADAQRRTWRDAGFSVTDTTCPLVRKAHHALATLVENGYFPVVIGQATHVEVRGLTGDYPEACVLLDEADLDRLPANRKLGIISQTTQPLTRVLQLIDAIKRRHPDSEVRFVDTVCHPTKQRQQSLEDLCAKCELIIVIGGKNSNNTRQLAETARQLGAVAHQVECADDLLPEWFLGIETVGVTAGTSTLDETVRSVVDRLAIIVQEPGLIASAVQHLMGKA